jgi:hypothetical protein
LLNNPRLLYFIAADVWLMHANVDAGLVRYDILMTQSVAQISMVQKMKIVKIMASYAGAVYCSAV